MWHRAHFSTVFALLVLVASVGRSDTIRIENAGQETFTYSIRETAGGVWSADIELEPNQHHSYTTTGSLLISYWTDKPRFATLEPNQTYRLADMRNGTLTRVTQTLKPVQPTPPEPPTESEPAALPELPATIPPAKPAELPTTTPTANPTEAPTTTPTANPTEAPTTTAATSPKPPAADADRPAKPASVAEPKKSPQPSSADVATPAATSPPVAPTAPAETEVASVPTVATPSKIESSAPSYVRVVSVLTLADDTYRRIPGWKSRITNAMAAVSAYYDEKFAVRFHVVEVRSWNYRGLDQSAEKRWLDVLTVDPGDTDLVVAFVGLGDFQTAQGEKQYTGQLGRAAFFGQHVTVSGWSDHHVNREITVLIHEIGHIFGAFHVADANSVMQAAYENIPLEDIISGKVKFGGPLEEMLVLTKRFDFHRGAASLNETVRRKIQELCRAHRDPRELAEQAPDPVTDGFKYLEIRAKAVAEQMSREAAESQKKYDATVSR